MPLYVGDLPIAKLYKGALPISRAYKGDVLVFSEGGEQPPPLDGLSGITSAASMARKLYTAYGGAFYTEAGGRVTQLTDQSGNGRHYAQGTDANRPWLSRAGPLERQSALFDGVSDSLAGANANVLFATSNMYLVMVAIQRNVATNISANPGSNNPWAHNFIGGPSIYFRTPSAGQFQVFGADGNTGSTKQAGPVTVVLGRPYVIEIICDATNIKMRVDGTTLVNSSAAPAAPSGNVFSIGGTSSSVFGFCDVFEVVTFNAIPSDAVRNALVANMLAHYGSTEPVPLDGLSNVTGAFSMSRKLLSAYVTQLYDIATGHTSPNWRDQSGGARNFAQGTSANQPFAVLPTVASRGVAEKFVAGATKLFTGANIGTYLTNGSGGYMVTCARINAAASTAASQTPASDDQIWGMSTGVTGVYFRNTGGSIQVYAGTFSGTATYVADVPIPASEVAVFEWIQNGTDFTFRVNRVSGSVTRNATTGTFSIGSFQLTMGRAGGAARDLDVFEHACFSAVPTLEQRSALVADMLARYA